MFYKLFGVNYWMLGYYYMNYFCIVKCLRPIRANKRVFIPFIISNYNKRLALLVERSDNNQCNISNQYFVKEIYSNKYLIVYLCMLFYRFLTCLDDS